MPPTGRGLAAILHGVEDTPRLVQQIVHDPALVFDLDGLIELFATEIIPAQISLGRSDPAVFFTPVLRIIRIA